MAGKCVLHAYKIKGQSHTANAERHDEKDLRKLSSKDKKHIDVTRTHLNQTLIPIPEMLSGLSRWDRLNIFIADKIGTEKKIRKDAVRSIELVLSASPEYFRPKNPGKTGTWEEDKLKEWLRSSMKYLMKRFGNNLLEVHLHLDEATPHLHCVVVPIVKDEDGTKRLCAKDFLMSRGRLEIAHDEYGKASEHLGLERGTPGSGAKYLPSSEWQADEDRGRKNLVKLARSVAKLPDAPTVERKVVGGFTKEEVDEYAKEVKKTFSMIVQDYNYNLKVLREFEQQTWHSGDVFKEGLKQKNSEQARELRALRQSFRALRPLDLRRVLADYPNQEKADSIEITDDGWQTKRGLTGQTATQLVIALEYCHAARAAEILATQYGPEAARADYLATRLAHGREKFAAWPVANVGWQAQPADDWKAQRQAIEKARNEKERLQREQERQAEKARAAAIREDEQEKAPTLKKIKGNVKKWLDHPEWTPKTGEHDFLSALASRIKSATKGQQQSAAWWAENQIQELEAMAGAGFTTEVLAEILKGVFIPQFEIDAAFQSGECTAEQFLKKALESLAGMATQGASEALVWERITNIQRKAAASQGQARGIRLEKPSFSSPAQGGGTG